MHDALILNKRWDRNVTLSLVLLRGSSNVSSIGSGSSTKLPYLELSHCSISFSTIFTDWQ